MTPLQLKILSHALGTKGYIHRYEFSEHEDTILPAFEKLVDDELLEYDGGAQYLLTDRGRCYLDAILQLPLPKWVMEIKC